MILWLGGFLCGIGVTLVLIGPRLDERESWTHIDPLPPSDCSRCGGTREEWIDDYHAVPCPWCSRTASA